MADAKNEIIFILSPIHIKNELERVRSEFK